MLKKLVCVLMACIFMLCTFVCAEESGVSVNVTFSVNDDEILISGSGVGEVFIMVAPSELSPEEMTDENNAVIFSQLTSEGAFSVTLGIPEGTQGGNYTVYANIGENEATDSFIYINRQRADEITELLSKEITKDGFRKTIEANAMDIGVDIEDEVYKEKSDMIIDMLFGMEFEDSVDFSDKYNKAYAYAALYLADEQKCEYLLEKYQQNLGIDYSESYRNDTRLDKEAKAEFLKLLSEIPFYKDFGTDEDNFSADFEQIKPLAIIRCAEGWGTIKKVICEDFEDMFKNLLEDSKYEKIKDKDMVFELMKKESYDEFDDISENFLSCVSKRYKAENSSKSSGGGSGSGSSGGTGGGGGAFSGGTSTPIVVPEYIEEIKEKYTDVPSEHWGFIAIEELSDKNILNGYEDGSFKPSNNVSRAEFTKMILCFLNELEIELEKNSTVSFSDVDDTKWYKDAVYTVAEASLVNGYNGLFRPDEFITREDAALILFRVMEKSGKMFSGSKIFDDRRDISDYARDAVAALASDGIINGYSDNKFYPKNNITRAEAAQLIYNALEN